jgi:hypothetical protein
MSFPSDKERQNSDSSLFKDNIQEAQHEFMLPSLLFSCEVFVVAGIKQGDFVCYTNFVVLVGSSLTGYMILSDIHIFE